MDSFSLMQYPCASNANVFEGMLWLLLKMGRLHRGSPLWFHALLCYEGIDCVFGQLNNHSFHKADYVIDIVFLEV